MRSTAANAELALLLEVAGTPKPGNVDREREYPDLLFEHFLAGAVGASGGLARAADPQGPPVGECFERAVAGMSQQSGGNTQFGALLVLVPLVRGAAGRELSPRTASAVARGTTVEDAAAFYHAFEHVNVTVRDPPEGMEPLDVRRGADAVPTLKKQGITLYDLMELSSGRDGIAREWTGGFERSFRAASAIADGTGPITDRAAETYLWLLSREPDTFVADNHGERVAHSVMTRAQEAREGNPELVDAFAESLVAQGINPGTTADVTAAGIFIALESHGVTV